LPENTGDTPLDLIVVKLKGHGMKLEMKSKMKAEMKQGRESFCWRVG
jgi:hypothetical protein